MANTALLSPPAKTSLPTILDHGFRPFFLLAGLWAALAMLLWIGQFNGRLLLPTAFDPAAWHAHEFLFGYLAAVIAGFLLTAVPNWTGRPRLVGAPLAALVVLWLAGRAAVMVSGLQPPLAVALVDLAMPSALALYIGREIVASGNRRNLVIVAMLALLVFANGLFHWQAATGEAAAAASGLRLGLGAALMMIGVIGGRIIPAFTRNWLVSRMAGGPMPASPMQRFDIGTLVLLGAALLFWVVAPLHPVTALLLTAAGIAHLARLSRWAGLRTGAEPLILILHIGYACLPLGALAMGAGIFAPTLFVTAAAQHMWMAGAIGLMTLAVMTRATLGHTNQPLHAGPATVVLYMALITAVLGRFAAGVWPQLADGLHTLSGTAWIVAFGGFSLVYGGHLAGLRKTPSK